MTIQRYQGADREAVLQRLHRPLEEDAVAAASVKEILQDVMQEGDAALFSYTSRFDGVTIDAQSIRVTEAEIEEAAAAMDKQWLAMLKRSAERIRDFHEKQKRQTWIDFKVGSALGQIVRPLERVGIYVPGGLASYPSSVLMNAIPAQVAGVKEIVMVSPPDKNGKLPPQTLLAAREAGVQEIYKVGGAQAVAALSYGTQSIRRVEKITGPGNLYVALAKRMVFGQVGIDSIAGPSELLVVADSTANPAFVAADMIAQAEHDARAAAVLITDDEAMLEAVAKELERQLATLPRQEIASSSLANFGALILVENLPGEGFDLVNEMAPEHLELQIKDPFAALGRVQNAGAIFLGNYAAEVLGDYAAGPNHVLPTNGTARFFSPLSVDDFIKKSSVLYFDQQSSAALASDVILFAESEGLDGHARSAAIRLQDKPNQEG